VLVFQEIILGISFNSCLDTPAHRRLLGAAALALSAAGSAAWAQPVPATASAATPKPAPPAFRSALEGYQPYTDGDAPAWKQANEAVGQIGGWRAYAREAQGGGKDEPETGQKSEQKGEKKGEQKSQFQPLPAKPEPAGAPPKPHAGHAGPAQP
jgi:hypothetical protein